VETLLTATTEVRAMRAVITHEFGSSSVEEVPTPDPTGDEVLIEVDRVQLDVTECYLYTGTEIIFHEAAEERIRDGGARLFGHEFVGTVAKVGPDVTGYSPGDRVYAPDKVKDPETGNKLTPGFQIPGALAEYIALPEYTLRKVPSSVSDAEAATLQPLASSILCVRDAAIEVGDVVVVHGTGSMGYPLGQLALHSDAGTVITVDVVPEKLDLAEEKGMVPVDATEVDPVEAVHERTDGHGADVVFEAVGGTHDHASEGDDPLAQCFRMAGSGGTVVEIGVLPGTLTLDPKVWRAKQVDWVNPVLGTLRTGPNADTGDLAVQWVAEGRISVEETVTHELHGLESFEEAVEKTLNKREYGALGPAQIVLD